MLMASASESGRSPQGIAFVPSRTLAASLSFSPREGALLSAAGSAAGAPVSRSSNASRIAQQCLDIPLLARANVLGCDHDVVKPHGLSFFRQLFRRITRVAAVVQKPETIHFDIGIIAPPDAGEVPDLLPVNPHGLFAIRFTGRICFDHELPALPGVELRHETIGVRGFPSVRPGREERIA